MDHVAIDLGGKESQICVRKADGEIVEQRRVRTAGLGKYLAKQQASRVVVETCSEAFVVADWARESNHQVRVVPATLARALGVGARRVKTDVRDAQVLSEVSTRVDLPSVHVPSLLARERKVLSSAREALVSMRTQAINNVRGWMRCQALPMRTGAVSSFAQRVRDVALAQPNGIPVSIERLLTTVEHLHVQIEQADAELRQLVLDDPICQRLMTVPGVGPVTALRFVATVDDVSRFADAHQLQAYLGLTPGEKQSGSRQRRLGITKAGSPRTRRVLVQAAWVLRRRQPGSPIAKWAKQVELRRGKQVAIIALARKLAGILFALWRDQQDYNPQRTNDAVPTPPA